MVTFIDPVTGKELSYYLSKPFRIRWDKIREGNLKKKDEDRVYLVDGREGTGKSVFVFQQAKYIDPLFTVEQVCFTPDSFLERIRNSDPGRVIVFDEAFRGLSSKGSQSKVNKKIVQAMMECRQKNLVIFIVLPTFFLLEMYAAVLRSNALFHIYKDKKGHRRVKLYNFQKKSLLYNVGKKKGFSYAYPKIRLSDRFFNIYAIEEQEYRKMKLKALYDMEEVREEEKEDHKWKAQRDWLINEMVKKKFKQKEVVAILERSGYPISKTNISKIKAEVRKKEEKEGEKLNSLEEKYYK